MSRLARPITRDEIAAYQQVGVVLLRGVLDLTSVNALRRCIDEAVGGIPDPASGNDNIAPAAAANRVRSSGRFMFDSGVSGRLRDFRRFALSGPGPEIAAGLLGGSQINFFGDQIFVKEPGARERTTFHQDAAYFEIEGDQCCVLWVPVDPVTMESGAMMYWRGSHRDGKLYLPNAFVSQASLSDTRSERVPDIENNVEKFDIVHFDVEPGDVIVHHYRTVHGAGGNTSRYQVRRAASLRYCGDDIRFQTRPWAPRQLHHTTRLNDGDPLGGPDFPVVWRRRQDREAA